MKKKMAIHHTKDHKDDTADSSSPDALYCEEVERRWEEEDEEVDDSSSRRRRSPLSLPPILSQEQGLLEEDEELHRLFSKEQEQQKETNRKSSVWTGLRSEAVKRMLSAVADHGFSPATAVLAVNYLDQFLSSSHALQRDKPWMIQLVAVTCLSLAAKLEEIHVPLLLDLQVGDVKYLFEARTIQRMELLVLSTLQWKMHPVTPLSFIYHIITKLGLKCSDDGYWDFITKCENLILNAISDSKFIRCLPSMLAAATMMHVLDDIEHSKHLLSVLRTSKEQVDWCYQLVQEIGCSRSKRKLGILPESPVTVIDSFLSSGDSSDESFSDNHQPPSFKRVKYP